VISVAYLALAPDLPLPSAGSDAAAAQWMPVDAMAGELAFDHPQILADAVERARAKLEYTPLAAAFCAETFTIAELRHVYQVVWGVELDPRNFHRKVTSTRGFVIPADGTTTRDGGRPAQLFSVGPGDVLRPPLMRPGTVGDDR
jgi:8-oxo-dGTP diphosphatase